MNNTEKEQTKEEKALLILDALKAFYPQPKTLLIAQDAWQLLVATVLAAQCTDARVNTVTPILFKKYPDIPSMADANIAELEEIVRPTGFYHNKAKNLIACAKKLCKDFDGIVPKTMQELTTLAGLGRKTANVVLWGAYGINEGLAVDTHVKRITYRLGLTESTDPVLIEKNLLLLFPSDEWGDVNHRMVWFGRDVCKARKPACNICPLTLFCPRHGI